MVVGGWWLVSYVCCYRLSMGFAIGYPIAVAIRTPSFGCPTLAGFRRLFHCGCRLRQFPIGPLVVPGAVAIHRKKPVGNRGDCQPFGVVRGATYSVELGKIGRQRGTGCVIGVQKDGVGAVFGQGKIGRIPAIVANVAAVIIHA